MPARAYWIWPLAVSQNARSRIDAGLSRFDGLVHPAKWIPLSILAGVAPVAICFAAGLRIHPALTAILLMPLFISCIRADRIFLATMIVGVVIGIHTASVIGLTLFQADSAAPLLSGSDAYWQKTLHWIETGEDVTEYRPRDWLPEHVILLVGVCALSYTSWGFIPLAVGIQQLDLMNYYVGRLMLRSDHPLVMLLVGWHPWSFLRGLAYSVLIFETTSASLERLLGRPLSTRRRRTIRWILGLSLAFADAMVKWQFSDVIREILHDHLRAE
ncbi:MAG: hypothetical protein U0798_06710 [Gemmataceae bacterium]